MIIFLITLVINLIIFYLFVMRFSHSRFELKKLKKGGAETDIIDFIEYVCLYLETGHNIIQSFQLAIESLSPSLTKNKVEAIKDKMNNGFSFFDAIQSTPIKNKKALKKSLMLLSMSHQYGRASLKLLKEYNINLKELITNKQEKIAAEAPIKMLFPLTFFILPVIFILLCSGAVLDFIKILE
jgi:tight adherence protein C